jgi:transcriptional regulator with XRE-family HTH domain
MKSRDIARAFGAVLKAARKAKGLSQEELAADAGIDRTYPSLLERGLREPTLTVLFQLSGALDRAPAALVDLTLARCSPAGGISPEAVPTRALAGGTITLTRPPLESAAGQPPAGQPPPPLRPHRAHDGPRARRVT